MPKGTFSNFTVAISGDFGPTRTSADLKRWIEQNQGIFNGSKVEAGITTHLVCSSVNYKKGSVPAVMAAERFKVPVVTYDWLEDCLMDKRRYKASGKYLCKTACRLSAAEKAARKARERAALKKDGTDPVPLNPNSAAGVASNLMDNLISNLDNKNSKDRKPDVENYTLYDKMVNSQASVLGGGKGGAGGETSSKGSEPDGDATNQHSDEVIKDATEHEMSSSSSAFESTPSVESQSSSEPTRVDSPAPAAASAASAPDPPASKPPLVLVSKEDIQRASPTKSSPSPAGSVSSTGDSSPEILAALGAAVAARKKAKRRGRGGNKPSSPEPTYPTHIEPIKPRLRAPNTDLPSEIENHHLYRDTTGYAYDVRFVRLDLQRNTNERYFLCLYESHTTPHTYAVHLRFSSSAKKREPTPSVKAIGLASGEGATMAPIGSSFETAIKELKRIFAQVAGMSWEERIDKSKYQKIRPESKGSEMEEKFFKFIAPKEGEPKGVFPPGVRF